MFLRISASCRAPRRTKLCEPEMSHSARFYEKKELGAKPNSLWVLRWRRRGDSNPHGFPHHHIKILLFARGLRSGGLPLTFPSSSRPQKRDRSFPIGGEIVFRSHSSPPPCGPRGDPGEAAARALLVGSKSLSPGSRLHREYPDPLSPSKPVADSCGCWS
jgi:hypothetical protein